MKNYKQIAMHFLENAKSVVGGAITGDGLFADDGEIERRRGICDACPLRDVGNDACGCCGCPIDNLISFKNARCDRDKWGGKNDEG